MSFNTWSIFSKALRGCDNPSLDLLTFDKDIGSPKSPLHVYTSALNSPSFDFITSLLITAIFPAQDLLRISEVKNLGVLAISGTGVSDYLVREWSRCASENGAFRVLRILRLWDHVSKSYISYCPITGQIYSWTQLSLHMPRLTSNSV
jgi:hypothetical protein